MALMLQGSGLLPPDPDPLQESDWLEAGSHLVPDEHVDDLQCSREDEHEDHYWRQDGQPFEYLDDPTAVYCIGR